ncbi:glycosyltransferase family 4 protein [Phormidium sp. FACHB-592]|uniref:Glycosyltransferase family 4 protein n=1 Tax=Stenomitos frigidus AS-A4 TaxID=2933935 RepID=A0ABV0KM72_9CYAN|nr:glycosyltransferase family 4 protein [Phormidium sp. FACHB-592]MBD2072644.1 glycosyltransferase family 4 protein [Phormidium sp. FACHB-592]
MEATPLDNTGRPLTVLLSAYACRPDKGSEPGVGWNMAQELARYHNVCVFTREENRLAIEKELSERPNSRLRVIFYDLPTWLRWWKRDQRGVHLHHYLWQFAIYFAARKLHREVKFDLVHHVTYGRYSAPSFLSLLPIPFVWGPLGGGESVPHSLWLDFSLTNKIYETLRSLARTVGEFDPFVRLTAFRSSVAITSTPETAERLKVLGVRRIEVIPGQTGINQQELEELGNLPQVSEKKGIRFVSIGRLLHWKGFHLGLRAFAHANIPDSEYWIIGDGAERQQLEALINELGVRDRVRFYGNLPRDKTLHYLGQCDALVHPSLHDFSPTVCLEAMAASRPVICLNLGGPAIQISDEAGFKIAATAPAQVTQDMANVMKRLATDFNLRLRMGDAGRKRVCELYGWDAKGQFFNQLYKDIASDKESVQDGERAITESST